MAPCTKIGNYVLREKIGEGAFAEVRIGVHQTTGERFAVKILDRSGLPKEEFERDVKKEIKIMKYLRHPSIVSIHSVLVTDSKMYLVMELVTGGELYDEIVNKKRIDERTSRKYFQQLVDAMVYCHKRGVVHRDLKPENLLLTEDGNLKITDFGMSWMKERLDPDWSSKLILQTQCGTPKYMAPEVILRSGNGYDGEKLDAWECGMILYALLAGYLPFNGPDDNSVFHAILRNTVRYPSHFSPGARDVLDRLLQKDPTKRSSLSEIRNHIWFLTDYKSLPVPAQAVRSRASVTISKDTRVNSVGAGAGPGVGASAATDVGRVSSSIKRHRSKSRSRLSQRLLEGALVVRRNSSSEEDRAQHGGGLQIVPQTGVVRSRVGITADADFEVSNDDNIEYDNSGEDDYEGDDRGGDEDDDVIAQRGPVARRDESTTGMDAEYVDDTSAVRGVADGRAGRTGDAHDDDRDMEDNEHGAVRAGSGPHDPLQLAPVSSNTDEEVLASATASPRAKLAPARTVMTELRKRLSSQALGADGGTGGVSEDREVGASTPRGRVKSPLASVVSKLRSMQSNPEITDGAGTGSASATPRSARAPGLHDQSSWFSASESMAPASMDVDDGASAAPGGLATSPVSVGSPGSSGSRPFDAANVSGDEFGDAKVASWTWRNVTKVFKKRDGLPTATLPQ